MSAAPRPGMQPLTGWQVLLIALVLALTCIGLRGLFDPDEGRYTNVALNMLDTGQWLMPQRTDGIGHWTKPPLTYWALASSFALFGLNEFAARIPSVLAFLGCIALVRCMAQRLVPHRANEAALLFATMLMPVGASQLVTTDFLLTFCETLAVCGYVCSRLGVGDMPRARWWQLAMWLGFGLAFLVKGPPGLLPALALLAHAWLVRGAPDALPRDWRWMLAGVALFLCVALPWYLAVTARVPGLLGYFTGTEVVARVASDVHRRNAEWYGWLVVYLPTLLLGSLPWTRDVLGWPRRLPAAWRGRAHLKVEGASAPVSVDLLLGAWVLLPLIVFCISRSRLPLYVLPLFPALALGAARAREWRGVMVPRFGRALAVAVAIALAGVLALLAPRLGLARYSVGQDARPLAIALQRLAAPVPPRRVLFVDDTPRYGLHLYLGLPARVERVTLQPSPQPAFGPEYDHTAAEVLPAARAHASTLWIAREDARPALEAWAARQGTVLQPLGPLGDKRFAFRMR